MVYQSMLMVYSIYIYIYFNGISIIIYPIPSINCIPICMTNDEHILAYLIDT